eukprot:CFRG5466T1
MWKLRHLLPKPAFLNNVQSVRLQHNFPVTQRARGLNENVFAAFSALALKHESINLGQGFPTFPCPDFLKEAVCEAIHSNANQYGRPGGHPELVNVLAESYSHKLMKKIDGMENITTFTGAQEGIAAVALSFVEPGDEVIVIEPYFDAYVNAVKIAGGKCVGVPLRLPKTDTNDKTTRSSNDYFLDMAELEKAITSKTKLLILNTPHNPTGKMFSKPELQEIGEVLSQHPNVLVLSDEVYEYSVYDRNEHVPFATIDGMWDRTISMYSVGKTFSVTGWRLGYAISPRDISKQLLKMRACLSFASVTPIEIGAARAFKECMTNNYYSEFAAMLEKKRDFLVENLNQAGIPAIIPQGGYFTVGDTSKSLAKAVPTISEDDSPSQDLLHRRDFRVARWLTTEAHVTGIPMSCFYEPENRHLANNVLRFCHAKDDSTMLSAKTNLELFAQNN